MPEYRYVSINRETVQTSLDSYARAGFKVQHIERHGELVDILFIRYTEESP